MRKGWKNVCINDIADIVGGSTPSTKNPNFFSGNIPWITPKDLSNYQNRYIYFGERNISTSGLNSSGARLLPKGSVLFSSRAPIGYVAIAGQDLATNQGFKSLIPKKNANSEFLFYLLKFYTKFIENVAGGTTFKEISGTALKNFKVSLPESIEEQKAIAAILGRLDEMIELNRQVNETLDTMAQVIFKSWFLDFDPVYAKAKSCKPLNMSDEIAALFPDGFEDCKLNLIPKGWKIKKLSEICSTQYGYTTSAHAENAGPKFLRVMDINKKNWIDWSTVPHCDIDRDLKSRYTLTVGDLVVARMADPGKSAIIEEDMDAIFASYLVRLKPESKAWGYFIYGFLKSDLYKNYAEGAKGGSVQANMNARVIVGTNLVIPPSALIEHYYQLILPFRKRLVANVRESHTLATIRDSLLSKLLSGEISINDAEKQASQVL